MFAFFNFYEQQLLQKKKKSCGMLTERVMEKDEVRLRKFIPGLFDAAAFVRYMFPNRSRKKKLFKF